MEKGYRYFVVSDTLKLINSYPKELVIEMEKNKASVKALYEIKAEAMWEHLIQDKGYTSTLVMNVMCPSKGQFFYYLQGNK